MTKKAKSKYDADGYRLRMVYGRWVFHLMKDGKWTGEQLGPFPWDQIEAEAKKLGLPDEDKKG